MEAKLASMNLKSPGLKSNMPASPTARNFSGGMNNFLSPDSAAIAGNNDPAATLAQQRARLKASNAAHRISAPALGSAIGDRNTWGTGSNQLGQVDERSSSPSGQELNVPSPANNSSRPKSTDFSGLANALKSPRSGIEEGLSPAVGGSWASMVNTPMMPMFPNERNPNQSLDAAAAKLNDWVGNNSGTGVPLISDPPKKFNRLSKGNTTLNDHDPNHNPHEDDSNSVGQSSQSGQSRGPPGNFRTVNQNGFSGQPGWNGSRSPALSNTSGRFSDDSSSMAGLGVGGFNVGLGAGLGMGMPGAPGFNMAALAGMAPMSPFNNMFNVPGLAAMGLSPEQILAMQMAAAAGQLGQPGLNAFGMNLHAQNSPGSGRSGRSNMRSPAVKSPNSRDVKKDEEDVDPKVLEDVPAWLRSLRLHKYTPNFEGMSWKDMVVMDEAALEAKGVAALGARRKMLKTFEIVRKKMSIDGPSSSSGSS